MMPKFHKRCILIITILLLIIYIYPDNKPTIKHIEKKNIQYVVVGFISAKTPLSDKYFDRQIFIVKIKDTYSSVAKSNTPKDILLDKYLNILLNNKILIEHQPIPLPFLYDLEFLRHPKTHILINEDKLLADLKSAEGTIAYQSRVRVNTINGFKPSFKKNKFYPYKDKYNNWTIGYGRLITYQQAIKYKNGITIYQADMFLKADVNCAKNHLKYFMEYNKISYLPQTWGNVLTELIFNTGLGGIMTFKDLIGSLQNQNFSSAKKNLFDSKWAGQIAGHRLERIKNELKQF